MPRVVLLFLLARAARPSGHRPALRFREAGIQLLGTIRADAATERNVRDRQVVEAIGESCFLKGLMPNVGIRVDQLREACGDGINLDTRNQRVGVNVFRHEADEMPQAQRPRWKVYWASAKRQRKGQRSGCRVGVPAAGSGGTEHDIGIERGVRGRASGRASGVQWRLEPRGASAGARSWSTEGWNRKGRWSSRQRKGMRSSAPERTA